MLDLFSAAEVPIAVEDTTEAIAALLKAVDALPPQKREKLTKLRYEQGVESWKASAYAARDAVVTGAGEAVWFAGVEQVKQAASASREMLWTGPWDAAMTGVVALMARPYMGQQFTYKDYGILCESLRSVGLRVHPHD